MWRLHDGESELHCGCPVRAPLPPYRTRRDSHALTAHCVLCFQAGIMVLALPMVIIGQAFEETIREEKKMALERERRLKIILLSRNQKAVLEDEDTSEQELEERDKLAKRVSELRPPES